MIEGMVGFDTSLRDYSTTTAYRNLLSKLHPYGENMIREMTVTDLSEKLKTEEKFILLDVRELVELEKAKITDRRLEVTPLSRLAQQGPGALSASAQSKDTVIYVMCHHGNRSMQVTAWLAQQGWKNVINVQGGIDEYARKVDRSVGMY